MLNVFGFVLFGFIWMRFLLWLSHILPEVCPLSSILNSRRGYIKSSSLLLVSPVCLLGLIGLHFPFASLGLFVFCNNYFFICWSLGVFSKFLIVSSFFILKSIIQVDNIFLLVPDVIVTIPIMCCHVYKHPVLKLV